MDIQVLTKLFNITKLKRISYTVYHCGALLRVESLEHERTLPAPPKTSDNICPAFEGMDEGDLTEVLNALLYFYMERLQLEQQKQGTKINLLVTSLNIVLFFSNLLRNIHSPTFCHGLQPSGVHFPP